MVKRKINKWEPESFELEYGTVWSFPERGDWATHDGSYRGNWSPYVARNLILRYSMPGDLLLDQFVGGGTTLIEAKLLQRNIIGVDINANALKICSEKCDFQNGNDGKVYIRRGDSRQLDFIPNSSIDFICTHPPYADIIKYSENLSEDLSRLDEGEFINAMKRVANECFRVLKKNKYCAILMGDVRKHGCVVPLGFKVMQVFREEGLKLKEIIIKQQHNCKATSFWKERSEKYNFLLLEHEYLFVFKKCKEHC